MWVVTTMAIIAGIFEIRYAYKSVNKTDRRIKRLFISIGISTILLGIIIMFLNQNNDI